jgi:hypothetical protein
VEGEAMSIQRYEWSRYSGLIENDNGDWMRHSDHLAALAAQRKEDLEFAGWLSDYSDKDTLDHWDDWNKRFNKNKLTNP